MPFLKSDKAVPEMILLANALELVTHPDKEIVGMAIRRLNLRHLTVDEALPLMLQMQHDKTTPPALAAAVLELSTEREPTLNDMAKAVARMRQTFSRTPVVEDFPGIFRKLPPEKHKATLQDIAEKYREILKGIADLTPEVILAEWRLCRKMGYQPFDAPQPTLQ